SKWPGKSVTLLDLADDVLGDRFRNDLRAELRHQLVELGVDVVLGEGLQSLPPTAATEFATFTITTETGRAITADIWFQCFGVTPVSDYLRGDLAAARGDDGFVAVGPTLQLPGQTSVFALGDMSAADAKMAGLASRQAQLVATNITKLAGGDDQLDEYASIGTAIIVPIGPEGGSGQLPGQDKLASREMVSNAKGRDLMVDRYVQVLGADRVSS
ncbi:MAG TPA: FAD-dependent oxidoreductase, partial [Acidimicrobiia bacterium]